MISLQDRDTQRVYRLCDFTKPSSSEPTVAYCVAGNVNSADRLYLVIDSVRPDTKHAGRSTVPVLLTAREGRLSANPTLLPNSPRLAPRFSSRRCRCGVSNSRK